MKDARDEYIEKNPAKTMRSVPKEVVDDLKFFAKRAKEGRQISAKGLLEYITKKYGGIGRQRLYRIAKDHGIEPWWSF